MSLVSAARMRFSSLLAGSGREKSLAIEPRPAFRVLNARRSALGVAAQRAAGAGAEIFDHISHAAHAPGPPEPRILRIACVVGLARNPLESGAP